MCKLVQCLAVAILTLALGAAPALAEKRIALVIGNDAYQFVPPLTRAVADARAFRHRLENEGGFQKVYYAENASESLMLSTIGRFLTAIEPGDQAMVVYSGHGVQLDPNKSDTLYLLPVDAPKLQPEDPAASFTLGASAVQFSALREQVAARGAKMRVFVLDACRDNPFGVTRDGTKSVGLTKGLAPMQAISGEFIFYAAAPGDQALDRLSDTDAHPNSVFSRVFLKHFRKGAYLEDIANDVQREVYDLASMATPSFSQRPYYDDGVIGRACMFGDCAEAPAPAAPSYTPPAPQPAPKPAPVARGVSPEELAAYQIAAQSSNADVLRIFLKTYPKTSFRPAVEAQIAALEQAAKPAPKPQPAPQPTPAPRPYMTHRVCNLNRSGDNFLSLRTGPSTRYREIKRMGPNTRLRILRSSGRWRYVELTSGQEGWSYYKYICRR